MAKAKGKKPATSKKATPVKSPAPEFQDGGKVGQDMDRTPIAGTPLPEPVQPPVSPSLKPGIHGEYVVVDRSEFTKLIKSLTFGYTANYQGLGLVSSVQKLFALPTFADAKKLTEIMLKGQ